MALTLQDVLERTSQPATPPLSRAEALDALSRAKRQMRQQGQLFRQIHANRIPETEIETVLLRQVQQGFSSLEPPARDALLDVLVHLDTCAPDLLSLSWGTDRYGPAPGNTLIDGIIGLARCQALWARPVATWQPQHRHERQRFTELARHLLARYDVPAFFDSVWFAGNHQEARQQQDWFALIGSGQNIRSAPGLPLTLTKKMAHALLQAPDDSTMTEALRHAQVVGCGGSPVLAAAINGSRLGRSFTSEDFWATVVDFLARHEDSIPVDWVRSLVDYLHHQRFVPQDMVATDGSLGTGPPAEPQLSMKSRSLSKLLRHVDRWRRAWSVDEEPPEDLESHGNRRLAYLYLETEDDRTGELLVWTIQELRTGRSLANEGQAMGHCLSSKVVKLSTTSIWSVQVRDGERTRRVMTVAIDVMQSAVTQARGRFNANPDRHADGPNLNDGGGGDRLKGRLSERELLRQSHHILRLWLDRENIAYSKLDL